MLAAIIEALLVGGGALVLLQGVIPAQTTPSPDAAGLEPATLPSLCAWLILALSLLRLAVVLLSQRRARDPQQSDQPDRGSSALPSALPPTPADRFPVVPAMVLIIAAGIGLLAAAGPAAGAALIVPATMLALGERRPLIIVLTTLGAIAASWPLR